MRVKIKNRWIELCKKCGEPVINRLKNAQYHKECYEIFLEEYKREYQKERIRKIKLHDRKDYEPENNVGAFCGVKIS